MMRSNQKSIQFHWRLIQGGENGGLSRARQLELNSVALPDLNVQASFSRLAEQAGIESLLTDISYGKPDPLLLASSIIPQTEKMKFLVAIRSGMISPTYFVQQVNTFSALHKGRLLINIVAGHSPDENAFYGDLLAHDQRYERTEEFLDVCRSFWNKKGPVNFEGEHYTIHNGRLRTPYLSTDRQAPFIFIAGSSNKAKELAISQGDCWMRLPDLPERVKSEGAEVLLAGKELGLRLAIICRDTKREAIEAANALINNVDANLKEANKENKFVLKSDSTMMKKMYAISEKEWLTPWLWTGAVKTFGAPTIAMVGTPDELSDAIMEYKAAGVTHFIFSGWPKQSEMIYFGKNVLPLVREKESLLLKSNLAE
ncbi:MAG: LLM class flavin-dependent oxidoreductase [Saprospiraceae bacterium]|nr:LLM class flavin-dependent oxidoreductase [Saprospiraceae bacterium]